MKPTPQAPKEFNQTDTDVPHVVSSFKSDSLKDGTIDRYNRSVRYIKSLDTHNP